MKKEKKTRGQLISELAKLRQRIAELEKTEAEHKLTEQTLRESKELFEKTFLSQLDAFFILDANNPPKILDCNPSTTRVFGYSRKEMLGRTTDFLHVDKRRRQKFQEHLYPAIDKQGFFHLPEFEMKRYGGTVFPTEHTVVSLEDDQGKRIGWVSVVRDISERKRMEESLLESEAYMKNILKAAPIGIGLVHNRVISWISDPMCAMLGYSEDELIGQSAKNVYESDEEFQRVGAVKYSEIQERGVGTVETRFKRKDGSILDVLLSSSAIDPEDFNKGIIFTALDITERKLMENALKESVENFKALAENANDGILIAVGEGDHVYANRRAAEITGYSIAELVEISLHKLVVPDEVEIVADRFKRRLKGEDVLGQYETLFVRKSSESFPVELSSARTDWEGQPASIVIVRDITNRKRAEEAVRKSEVALVEKSRHLEEVNVALRILLKQREADKADLEERLLANVKELVLPYVEKLKNSRLHSDQMTLVGILESNMKEIVSPFVTKLSSRFLSLTPTEIQVASLIKDGKSSKEIASLLHASENTVRSHRFHIRSKLGIKNKKVNLRSYLQSLQD